MALQIVVILLSFVILLQLKILYELGRYRGMSFKEFFNYMYDYKEESLRLLEQTIIDLKNHDDRTMNKKIDERIELHELIEKMKNGKK